MSTVSRVIFTLGGDVIMDRWMAW